MGALAQALRKPQTVTIEGINVPVTPLSVSQLFDCIAEAGRGLDIEGKSPEKFAEEVIASGQMPVKTFGVIIKTACPDLDDEDVTALLADSKYTNALRVIAVAMGEDPDSIKIVKPTKKGKKGAPPKKKRSRSTGSA